MFWVFRLGYLVGWQFKFWNKTTQTVRVRRRLEARKQKTCHFRGRSLQIRRVIAIGNRNRIVTRRYTPQDRQHSRWRRRQRKLKHRVCKRRVLDREELSKKRKLLHQKKYKTILQRKYHSSLQRKLRQSSLQRKLAVGRRLDLTVGVGESSLQRKLAVRVPQEEDIGMVTISCCHFSSRGSVNIPHIVWD